MIKFPKWVGARADEGTACRRLRYLVLRAAIETTEKGSIATFAEFCGVDRPNMHAAMRTGIVPPRMAALIEKACGRKLIRREWLTHPLDIEEMVDQ